MRRGRFVKILLYSHWVFEIFKLNIRVSREERVRTMVSLVGGFEVKSCFIGLKGLTWVGKLTCVF